MKAVYLTDQQFDNFSVSHPFHSYYQTTAYGKLMSSFGFTAIYYGFIEENKIIGASLILMKKLWLNFKCAYAPRGPLLDYNDKEIVEKITTALKTILSKEKVAFLKIDPLIIKNVRDYKGNILPYETNNQIIPFLEGLGYKYFGENLNFETMKPRWNAIIEFDNTPSELFKQLDKSARNKIRKAISRGIVIEEVSNDLNNIELFYKFVARKHFRKLNYYQNCVSCFGNNFKIFFAKINTTLYLKSIKQIYADEQSRNEILNEKFMIANLSDKKREHLLNNKLNSDKLLATYKKEVVYATNLSSKNPNGIVIGAASIIKEVDKIRLLIEGYDLKFRPFYPTFLLNWYIIEKYAKSSFSNIDLNGVSGDFSPNNRFAGLTDMKTSFNSKIYEYVGEFDLVLDFSLYTFYKNSKFSNKILKTNIK